MATWKLVSKALEQASPAQLIRVRSLLTRYRNKHDYGDDNNEALSIWKSLGVNRRKLENSEKEFEKAIKAIEYFDNEKYFGHEIAEILDDEELSDILLEISYMTIDKV